MRSARISTLHSGQIFTKNRFMKMSSASMRRVIPPSSPCTSKYPCKIKGAWCRSDRNSLGVGYKWKKKTICKPFFHSAPLCMYHAGADAFVPYSGLPSCSCSRRPALSIMVLSRTGRQKRCCLTIRKPLQPREKIFFPITHFCR